MGEPFRQDGPGGGSAAWFAQADRDHDGRLSRAEFRADADRFHALLDVNHDGEIDPAEIDRYETEIAPEIRVGASPDVAMGGGGRRGGPPGGPGGGGPGGGPGGGGPGGGGGMMRGGPGGGVRSFPQGAARYGYLDLPEPVVAADANFNRGVMLAEFRAAAERRFDLLDPDRDGFISQSELPMRGGGRGPRRGGRDRPPPPPPQ
jgi:hypothetical protein